MSLRFNEQLLATKELKATKNFVLADYCLKNNINGLFEGGSRSGKTYGIAMAICNYLSVNTGKIITIARDTRETLKITAYETLKKVWMAYGYSMSHFNKNMSNISYRGNTIRFVGINDDPDRALGAEQHVLWVNEAITSTKSILDQMEQRTDDCCLFDYNPSEVDCWLYKLEFSPMWKMLKTTMLDNPYVPAKHKAKILSYEPTPENIEAGTADKYMWEVYGQGKRAVGENSIFKSFNLYKDEPTGIDWEMLGGDFGYTTDPSCLLSVKKKGDELYIRELFYEHGFLNADIARKLKELGVDEMRSVWDSAPPQNVVELRLLNIDAVKAKKGFVFWRLEKLKQFKIFIHVDSENAQDEFRSAKWMKDKEGNYTRNSYGHFIMKEESPKKDHCLDAIGYALSYYYDMTGL